MLGQEGRAVAKQKPSTPEKFRANRIVAWQRDQKDTLLAIAAMARSGFKECAEMADMALHQFIEETVLRMACEDAPPEATRH